jgi:hypothetical protein
MALKNHEFRLLLSLSGLAAILVYGSFTVMLMQALWWNHANVLDPVKTAIVAGYIVLVLHLLVLLKRRNILVILDLALLIASLYSAWNRIEAFLERESIIGLGVDTILLFDVRVVISIALLLPMVFVILAGLTAGAASRLREGLEQVLDEIIQDAAKKLDRESKQHTSDAVNDSAR